MTVYDWRKEVEQLSVDATSGSSAVCMTACDIIFGFIDSLPPEADNSETNGMLKEIARAVRLAKPAMAGLYTLAAAILEALDKLENSDSDHSQFVRRAVVEFRTRLQGSNDAIAKNALDLLPDRACVTTISNSGTVISALKLARDSGKLRRVVISEGRPASEGRKAAIELADYGIPVAFVSDSALPGTLDECDAVFVGGDALCPSGLVNKTGTYALALAAERLGKNFAALVGTEKVLPFDIPANYLREDPDALWDTDKITIQVVNRIFEYTPLELVGYVVTEDGVSRGAEVPYIFAKMKINPYLENI